MTKSQILHHSFNHSPKHSRGLNIEVARSNMPGTPAIDDIYYDTLASSAIGGSEESTFFEFSVDGNLLQVGNNVVAVEIHQGRTSSSDISFDLQLDGAGTATLLKGPYLYNPGVNSEMTVLWQLNAMAACTIEWGQDTNYDDGFAITSEYGSDHQHKYTITALIPGEKYFYRVVNGASEYTGSFHAAPPDNAENVRFLAYGDTRSNPSDHDSVAAEMINTYTDDPDYQTFALHRGDWVNDGDAETDWADQFFPQTQLNLQEFIANVPINGCKGNHEGSGGLFYKYWPYPYVNNFYWSFDYGPVHVVVLDQYVSYSQGSTQYNWLENDLAMTTKPWKIIVFHEPGWSAGGHANNTVVQDDIQPLCETYGVDIVFAGHNHYYARADVNGIQHITTGGGGAPLTTPDLGYPYVVAAEDTRHFCGIEIQGETLYLNVWDTQGRVIDALSLTNEPPPICGGQDATIIGTEGDNVIIGTDGDDVIVGLGCNDIIYGLDGRDRICGGNGDDTIYGGKKHDVLLGEGGNDTLRGENGPDRLVGGNGNDTLDGGGGKDKLFGGVGNDTIAGGSHDDELEGNDGVDVCDGGDHDTGDTAVTCECPVNIEVLP